MIVSVNVRDYFETYTRCYFLIDEITKHGFLVDPGAEAEKIVSIIRENDWTIEKVLLTHGHFDHLEAVETVCERLDIPYCIHENGKKYLEDPMFNLSGYCGRPFILQKANYFRDGDEMILEKNPEYKAIVIHTPGHTEDSVTFYLSGENAAIVGDTIFRGSIGSTQYPGGNSYRLPDSIEHRIFCLPKETRLLSGHSDETTVEIEMKRYRTGV